MAKVIMKKTLQMMKEIGLLDSLVHDIMFADMPKEHLPCVLDAFCKVDENFEDAFLNDIREIGHEIIWSELCFEANKRKEETLKKQDDIEDLLKKIIELLSE